MKDIVQTCPRDELLQMGEDEPFQAVTGIPHLSERLEAQPADATPSWSEDLHELADGALFAKLGSLERDGSFAMRFYHGERAVGTEDSSRLNLFRLGEKVSLSQLLRMLENLGVRVVDERPYRVETSEGPAWIYDLGLSCGAGELDDRRARELFEEACHQIWRAELEDDGFNRLVLRARLSGRQVMALRALSGYQRQVGSAIGPGYVEAVLAAHPDVARLLVELFTARFDPDGDRRDVAILKQWIEAILDAIPSLEEDRILRDLWALLRATLRTNYFQQEDGAHKAYVSFKFDPALIPDLPLPRPMFEIWVYSPRMEGCHLRAGRVARGGIRWSDRREDFRIEILGLMEAQTVKNAVIVPVGAKGGAAVTTSGQLDRRPQGGRRDGSN